MKLNKVLIKKITANVLITIFVLLIAEIFCILGEACVITKEDLNEKSSVKQITEHLCSYIPFSYMAKREFNDLVYPLRKPVEKNTGKKQIIIAGCSFAYGLLLEEEDCIHKILSDMTGRTVSNIAVPSGSEREALWFFMNKDRLFQYINKEQDVDYIIYICIDDHKRRLFFDLDTIAPQYRVTDNGTDIEFLKDKLYRHTFLYRNLKLAKYHLTPQNEVLDLQNLFLRKINEKSKELFPNSKFVVLNYAFETSDRLKELEKDGIKVITLGDCFGDNFYKAEYKTIDNLHPNGKCWKRVAEILKKELNM